MKKKDKLEIDNTSIEINENEILNEEVVLNESINNEITIQEPILEDEETINNVNETIVNDDLFNEESITNETENDIILKEVINPIIVDEKPLNYSQIRNLKRTGRIW